MLRGIAAASAIGLFCLMQPAAADERTEAGCAEARARYLEIAGRAASDEPFTVVLMYRSTFCLAEVTVERGGAVRWVNVENRTSHSIWFKDAGLAESERVFPGESIEMSIDLPVGEHTYLCGPHWERQNMIGRLRVVETARQ